MRHLQKRGTRTEFLPEENDDFFESADGSAPNPLNLLLDEELFEKVEAALAKLPTLQREAIILREIHELSCEEIAQIVNAETGAIKVRLHRARKSLAREIAPYLSVKKKEMNYEMR